MPVSELMNIILDTENMLGWCPPPGRPLYMARAAEHRKLTLALARSRYSERDLRLAIAYCRVRQHPISAPCDLIALVPAARELEAVPSIPGQLDLQIRAAIDWETARADEHTGAWITRLVRSFGPARADTLTEWAAGGRGER